MYAPLEFLSRAPAVDIARFKHNLGKSQGADLVLRFVAPLPPNPPLAGPGPPPVIESQPDEESQKTKLFVHGMHLIDLYRNQLAVLDLNVAGNRTLRHCCGLLFDRPAPRLTAILFTHRGWQLPIFTNKIWNSEKLIGFESLNPKRSNPQTDLKHLISLNCLQLPALPWLEDFRCSSSIHLILNSIKVDDNPERFKLVRLSHLEFTGPFPLKSGMINLPHLTALTIMTDSSSASRFFAKASLPALQRASISIQDNGYPTPTGFPDLKEKTLTSVAELRIPFPRGIHGIYTLELL